MTAAAPTFGIAYASLGGQSLVSAASALEVFEQHGWDDSVFEGRANSFTSPLGEEYGYGKVLMMRDKLDELSTSEPHILRLGIGQEGNEIELHGIYIRGATRISPGTSHEDAALYLVDLVDTRYKLAKYFVQQNLQFNCRRTGGTADNYNDGTLQGTYKTKYTWIDVIDNLWFRLYAEAPTDVFPSFSAQPDPILPDYDTQEIYPENLRYDGLSLWAALNDAARRVGCAILFDNAFVHNFYLVRLGRIGTETVPQFHSQGGSKVTVPSASAAYWSAGNTTRIKGDGLFADKEVMQGDVIIPRKIGVMFPTSFDGQATGELESPYGRWYQFVVYPGDSETDMVQNDYYDRGGRIPDPDTIVGNKDLKHVVYETKHARFAAASDATPANEADLKKRAVKIAEDVYRTLVDCAGAHVSYAGIHYDDDSNPTIPGKTVSEVTWGDFGNGLRTDIYRSPPDLMPTKRPIRVIDAVGGGGGKIWFTVLEIDYYLWILPGCERVRAVVTQISCETTAVAVGDEVYIYDPVFCYFNVPIVILMQLRGTATLSQKGSLNLTACGITVPDCFWAVDSVHCLEEEYAI